MRKQETVYRIARRIGWVNAVPQEYTYVINKGNRLVAKVGVNDAEIKCAYDQKGQSICPFSITDAGTGLPATKGEVVAYLLLLHAHDLKTAMEWYKSVAGQIKLPTNVSTTISKADLFEMILESQRIRSIPGYGRTGHQG